jgi:hypothetical protein
MMRPQLLTNASYLCYDELYTLLSFTGNLGSLEDVNFTFEIVTWSYVNEIVSAIVNVVTDT